MRVIRDAVLADGRVRDIRLDGERIDAVGTALDGELFVDANADYRVLPGMIDAHVHFRQPGFEHKETWASGSRSAAAGGVTTVVDQPNTAPPTVTGDAVDEKAAHAAADSVVDWGVNGGVTGEWDPASLFDRSLFALGEVFLADSTGDMGIDAALFRDACQRAASEDVVVTVHAEDADRFDTAAKSRSDADAWSAYRTPEAEAAAVERAVEVGTEAGATIHIAHTSTPEGVDAAAAGGVTCEATPHHLFLSRDDLDDLGTFGRMNPPLRSDPRREALFERLADGRIDVVATDHAPHTRAEKAADIWDAPSGVPGVETALPLLLGAAHRGELSYERVRDVTAANPADVFGLERKGHIAAGRDADLVLVDPDDAREIHGDDLHSNCEWTPFEGHVGVFPAMTLVRGTTVWDGDTVSAFDGRNVRQ
ncbi:dihydroorotase [Halobacterium salinarum]|uniref:dihydroorotase n=1 Tax=Halobacterium salinarum TaxID=2242 RepID=UPI002552BF5F|nr:dihydroorotase [Halobacterium salinarum]MDL0141964.1 dihydroorotase [Halobacterium salinarum]MDL0143403.1 dihydroorotase [Halobacterium salinarum]